MRVLIAACASALALGGCATVTRGTTNEIQIVSEPSGARATTSLAHSCVTPCTLQVSRKEEFTVVFELPGYQRQEIAVRTHLAGSGAAGFAGNLLIGGAIGMGVDAATGSTLEHLPNPVRAVLVPIGKEPSGRAKHRAVAPRKAPSPEPKDVPETAPEG